MTGEPIASPTIREARGHLHLNAGDASNEAMLAARFALFDRKIAATPETGPVRALIDLRHSRLQLLAILSLLSTRAPTLHRNGSRVALLTATTLLKVQLRRILPADRFGIFVSPGAAYHYLDRDEGPAMASAIA